MKYRWISNIVVAGLLIYLWVDAGTNVKNTRSAPESITKEIHEDATASLRESRSLEDYTIISERNLFGDGYEEPETSSQQEAHLQMIPSAKTSLGLKLVGTVVARSPEDSFAIIEDRGKRKQEIYHEGDRVKQAYIKRILRHNVIINTGTRDEMLTMKPEERTAKTAPPARTARRPKRQRSAGPIRLEREELESSLADLNQLMKQVRIRPYMEGNRPGGFLVSNIKPGSLFARMGLRNGDVIQGVNDQSITSPEQAIEFYESLMEGGEIALEIKRGRRKRQLRYEIE